MWSIAGTLPALELADHPELLADPVRAALSEEQAARCALVRIDPDLADTAQFCAAYESPPAASANCVVVSGKRGGMVRLAACMVLATTRAEVNTVVRKRLDVRKASFAPMAEVVAASGMAYGGITPIGLPADWPVYVDPAVAQSAELVIGSGIRGSKLLVPGELLAGLPTAEVLAGLGVAA
ncbi:MAG: YbaK/EbsC family protein [Sciscionella sp.]